MEVDADSFVGVKGVKARGRRVTTFKVKDVEELVPLRMPELAPEPANAEIEPDEPENADNADDENSEKADDGQLSLF